MGRRLTPLAKWVRGSRRTQSDLAAELRITPGYLSLLVNGIRQPSLPLAVAIAKVTGLSVDSLIKGERA